MSAFVVVIPARFDSSRLPGKPLREINGKPMLQHVYERGIESGASQVVIATDDERIAAAGESFAATVCMTRSDHQSGTERIAEVADLLQWRDDKIVVNLQGDEPAMPAILIDECASLLQDDAADIATLASPFLGQDDFDNPNCVKVVCDQNKHALYFSRAGIPYARDDSKREYARRCALHHHGIYAYRCGVLRRFVAAPAAALEQSEHLEQLRALALGMTIAVGVPSVRPGTGVDTESDLARAARELLSH